MDNIAVMILIFLILLMASGFFSASETSLTGANRVRLKSQQEQGSRAAGHALRLVEHYDKTLSTLLIGNNIVNTLLASLATVFCSRLFEESGVGIATAAVTILVVIFGEVTPKSYAGAHPEQIIKRTAPVILVLNVIFTPLSAALQGIRHLLLPKNETADPTVTEDELKVLFDQSVDEGVLEEDRSELLQNALEFDDTEAEDILTPRVSLAAVELNDSRETIQNIFLEKQFTRLPVYRESLDQIVGVVSQKDFFAAIVTGGSTAMSDLMQPCLYIPPCKKIDELMTEMQRRHIHLAVVTDEYGGTMGVVTLEDILEELVGDIWDEHDRESCPVRLLEESLWEVRGDASIDEVFEELCRDDPLPETESVTIAGLALEQLEHIPAVGETFRCGRMDFTVTSMAGNRIHRLRVFVHKPAEEDRPVRLGMLFRENSSLEEEERKAREEGRGNA